ncbi:MULTISPECIES: right-handed parallel beta-helix repeat-containing protein [Halorussus]|uniref:right-handed parallel beta-helix repeat-containing protein n=1 Tax=Halorussus TaxID=1070314 RepID=UPI00209D8584|nr:right-handed parallel beta-helix repeat-containing protein [Halorussus vallis]USZ76540.1 right-handed parallel beta-helix repeat-containing protein [Halorussus vallis]
MARDEMARDSDSDKLLDRRSYLKMAGAAAASVTAAGVTADGAKAASYDTIKVPAGSRRTIKVGPGETFENKLIDITADGAHVKLLTQGSGWTIRNVGLKGVNNDRSDTYGTFYLRCTDGGEGLAENIYMGDGTADRAHHAAMSDWDNSGTVTIRNIHVQGWGADGMYMSHAGVSQSHGMGDTRIENAYLKNNNIENARLGTPGSYIKDSVVHVEGEDAVQSNESGQKNPRGLWFKEQSGIKAINCDIKVNGAYAVFASDNGSGTLENCRVDGRIGGPVTKKNVSGNPDVTPPKGVPMSAEEAASGNVGGGSTSAPTTSDDQQNQQDQQNAQGTPLELVSSDDASSEQYQFTVEGAVHRKTSGSVTAESGDKFAKNDDGTVTVSGVAGNGYGDAFLVDGCITAMDIDESKWTLRYDGSEVAVSDIVLPNALIIDGSDHPRQASTYEFAVSGTARKSAALATVNPHDTVEGGKISGRVIGGKDAFRYSGEITGFTLSGPANVRVQDGS